MSTASSLVALARPKGTLLLLAVPLTGYGFAHWDYGIEARRPLALAFVLAAWSLLSAGSLWLNAALDGDEEGALFSNRVARPKHLVAFGYLALALSVAFAFIAGPWSGAACFACAALAILYSHPRTMWKAHPLFGPFVNGVGYGLLSWIAGFAIVGVAMSARTAAAMSLLTLFILGMYFAAQAYQREDDARRGYRTLVVTRGPAACLRVATICMRVTLASVFVLAAFGIYPRLVLLGFPAFILAERTMSRWRLAPGGGTPALAAEFAMRMLGGGTILVTLATIDALR